jgi:hypothetical protein
LYFEDYDSSLTKISGHRGPFAQASKGKLRQGKKNPMFFLIHHVLIGIPFKIRSFFHKYLASIRRG